MPETTTSFTVDGVTFPNGLNMFTLPREMPQGIWPIDLFPSVYQIDTKPTEPNGFTSGTLKITTPRAPTAPEIAAASAHFLIHIGGTSRPPFKLADLAVNLGTNESYLRWVSDAPQGVRDIGDQYFESDSLETDSLKVTKINETPTFSNVSYRLEMSSMICGTNSNTEATARFIVNGTIFSSLEMKMNSADAEQVFSCDKRATLTDGLGSVVLEIEKTSGGGSVCMKDARITISRVVGSGLVGTILYNNTVDWLRASDNINPA